MSEQGAKDREHLRLLTIFHYVLAGVVALIALFPIFHLAFGIFMLVAPEKMASEGEQPPAFLGWFMVIFAAVFILGGWLLASFILWAGKSLKRRKRRTFFLVMGGIECAFMPLGTVLGVFTIIVLMRDSVQTLFEGDASLATRNVSDDFESS